MLGEGRVQEDEDGMVDMKPYGMPVSNVTSLINNVYPHFCHNYRDEDWLKQRAILAPRNVVVAEINDKMNAQVPGEAKVYKSIDRTCEPEDEVIYTREFLNSRNEVACYFVSQRVRVTTDRDGGLGE